MTTLADDLAEARARAAETAAALIRLNLPDAHISVGRGARGLHISIGALGEAVPVIQNWRQSWQNALGFEDPFRKAHPTGDGYDLVSTGTYDGVPVTLSACIYPFQEAGA